MINKKLYHLSFNASLEGVWTPKNPDGLLPEDSEYVESVYPEPSTPRISCAPTIIQCFQAIYPNVKSLFDVNNYPHLDFYVYSPVFKGGEKVMTPDELCKKRMVHDAYVTGEHCIFSPVKMDLVGKVRINRISNVVRIYYRPFNDPKLKKDSWIPGGFTFSVLNRYKNIAIEGEIISSPVPYYNW